MLGQVRLLAAAATAVRERGAKLNMWQVSIMLSCRVTAFTVCFVSSCKSFTDGSSAAGEALFQVDG